MATIWKNKIPALLESKGLSITDLQKLTQMSYPSTHRVATSPIITDDTKVVTLRRVADALKVSVTELFEEVSEE